MPGCQKAPSACTRGMRFPSARELPRPANGADAPAREAHAGSHAAGAHAGRSLRRAPRGPARVPPPAPRAAPLARGGDRRPGNGGGSLPPGRPLPARSVTLAPFPEHFSARGGARRRPDSSLAARLAGDSRCECAYRAPAARAVGRPGLIPVGSRPGLGPWQGTPDVGTHAGSPLPLGRPFPPGWRQAPDVCARIGSLLPWVRSRLARTIPHLGERQVGLVRAAFPPAGRHSHRALAATWVRGWRQLATDCSHEHFRAVPILSRMAFARLPVHRTSRRGRRSLE